MNDTVIKVQYYISKNNIWKVPDKAETPMPTMDQPELDATTELHHA